MPAPALYTEYDFPSRDRIELYGDDQLIHVYWADNMFMCAAACLRAPRAMPWAQFKAAMVDEWAAADPDYDPAAPHSWRRDDEPIEPKPDQTLEELGIPHKGVVSFRTGPA
ncbi:phenol hydroxylase subunit P4 [Pseudonocardia sp. WMMC193]|uniref:phenol hydroxylase subunit P4 n=1 Tax=Pseudonocardia sp. WMMC193 TaxID=2911965 RepID=UPI001F3F8B79|nr:phenol hydroxylase subunit P4 [Pseudonocardia sp. WMMC193]MCF7550856.1 phenol hydroxylase subunit P4 [Pseudonocardia sp. WMMC193]